jgi:hypothetical protein
LLVVYGTHVLGLQIFMAALKPANREKWQTIFLKAEAY